MYRSNQPVLQSAYINNDKDAQKRTMSLIVCSFAFMDIIGMLLATGIGLPILRLIRPETVVASYVLLALGAYQFILNFRNCYTSYFSCTNRIPYVKSFLISSILCVGLAFLTMGVFKMGIWGIIFAQIVSQCVYNAWAWSLKAHKEMELSAKETIWLGYIELKKIFTSFLNSRRRRENAQKL